MSDYSKLKNAELEALLKQRSLPHTGKKADLISRLQEDDGKKNTSQSNEKPASDPTTKAPEPAPEDEIDWDDDTAELPKPSEATTEPAAAAMAAGGIGRVANPTVVPNQIVDPTDINDSGSTIHPPADATVEAATNGTVEAKESEVTEEKTEEKPAVDFTRGLASTTMEEELEKRRARAKKFGIEETDEEAVKRLERAKKFGTEAGQENGPKGLNEALPERRESKKRGREEDGGPRDNKRRGRLGGRKGGGAGGGGDTRGPPRNRDSRARENNSKGSWMSEKDRAAAEARKSRFATAT